MTSEPIRFAMLLSNNAAGEMAEQLSALTEASSVEYVIKPISDNTKRELGFEPITTSLVGLSLKILSEAAFTAVIEVLLHTLLQRAAKAKETKAANGSAEVMVRFPDGYSLKLELNKLPDAKTLESKIREHGKE